MAKLLKRIYSFIRNLPFVNTNKEFLIFLIFLVLSAAFWFINVMNESYEAEVLVPVKITKVPANVVITTDIQDSLHVTIRDNGFALLKYMFHNVEKPIYVAFDEYSDAQYSGEISVNSLSRQIRSRFRQANIVSVKPDRLDFFYNYGSHKKVPVHLAGNITPADMYYLSKIKLSPDSVTIFATEEMLDSIKYAPTKPLNINNLSDTMQVNIGMVSIRGVKFEPNKINVRLYPDIYAEDNIEVPITCRNLPEGKTLRTFPSKATVHFVAGLKNMRSIIASDFVVEADYNEFIADTLTSKCHLILLSVPDVVSRATLTTTDVEYLIEE